MRLYAEFSKRDEPARMVYGYASTEALDSHGEIVAKSALNAALPEFMRFGNIREMHQPSAVGKAQQAEIDDKGLWLGAKIVDPDAWEKVKEGVYSGFSIAGRVTKRDPVRPHIITGLTLSEISLVDRPANPEAVFTMYKNHDIEKKGARNSAADLERIQAVHDHARDLGATCPGHAPDQPPEDDGPDDSAAKAAGGDLGRVVAALQEMAKSLSTLNARVLDLEKRPRHLGKADGSFDLAKLPPSNDRNAHELIKDALRRPMSF